MAATEGPRFRSRAARVHNQRGDGRARRAHYAHAGGGHYGRARSPRSASARRGVGPRGREPHPRRHRSRYFASRRDLDATARAGRLSPLRATIRKAAQQLRRYIYALFEGVIARQARLIAQWMLLGFIHGVMNTDNMALSGETIDYGPCAFMEEYHPGTVFSSIDANGRYAYGNQPTAALWNLARLAESILPLLAEEAGGEQAALTSAREALSAFDPQLEAARRAGLLRKIGLVTERAGDAELAEALLERMATHRADFTLTFRGLCDAAADSQRDQRVRELFADPTAYDRWAEEWRHRLAEDSPSPRRSRGRDARGQSRISIPRNHLGGRGAQRRHKQAGLFSPSRSCSTSLTRPYEDRSERANVSDATGAA